MYKKISLILIIISISIFSISAQTSYIGTISFFEGEFTISHNGEIMQDYQIDFGHEVFAGDIITTEDDGMVEIAMTVNSGGSTLLVKPDTSLFVQREVKDGVNSTNIQTFIGSIALKVNKLTSNEAITVSSENTTMGVRGTEFEVSVTPDSSVLVTCSEGRVACSTATTELFAEPGQVCFWTLDDKRLESMRVPVIELNEFQERWWNERSEILGINAFVSIQFYSRSYLQYADGLERTLDSLRENSDIFVKWNEISKGNRPVPGMADVLRDSRAVTADIIRLRSFLILLEQAYYNLVALEDYASGISERLDSNMSINNFYRNFNRNKNSMKRDLIQARFYMSIYKEMFEAMPTSVDSSIFDTPIF